MCGVRRVVDQQDPEFVTSLGKLHVEMRAVFVDEEKSPGSTGLAFGLLVEYLLQPGQTVFI